MKIGEALSIPDGKPPLEDRVKALEVIQAAQHGAILAALGTLAYNSPEFAKVIIEHVSAAANDRKDDDSEEGVGGR